jgi:hypothetical protein
MGPPGDLADDLEVLSACRTVKPASSAVAAMMKSGMQGRGAGRGRQDLDRAVLDRRGLERPLSPGSRSFRPLGCNARRQSGAPATETNAARSAAGKSPVGFLDPLLYSGVGAADYTGSVPQHSGSGPKPSPARRLG